MVVTRQAKEANEGSGRCNQLPCVAQIVSLLCPKHIEVGDPTLGCLDLETMHASDGGPRKRESETT